MSTVNGATPRVATTATPTQTPPTTPPGTPPATGDQAGTPVECRGVRDGGSPEALRACLQKFAQAPSVMRLLTGIAPRSGAGGVSTSG